MKTSHEDPANSHDSSEVARWRVALATAGAGRFAPIEVLATVDSTQDHLRRNGPAQGHLVTTLRQTAGRGRLGRRWLDDAGEGVALSVALPLVPVAGSTSWGAARLMMISGLAVVTTLERYLPPSHRSGLKWPNDVLVDGRKIAGSLVEVVDGVALLGIGINVGQREFDGPLAATATSLAVLGVSADRCAVAADLVRALVDLEPLAGHELRIRYQARDCLRGTHRVFEHAGHRVGGTVQEVDPLGCIRLLDADGAVREIDARLASLVHDATERSDERSLGPDETRQVPSPVETRAVHGTSGCGSDPG